MLCPSISAPVAPDEDLTGTGPFGGLGTAGPVCHLNTPLLPAPPEKTSWDKRKEDITRSQALSTVDSVLSPTFLSTKPRASVPRELNPWPYDMSGSPRPRSQILEIEDGNASLSRWERFQSSFLWMRNISRWIDSNSTPAMNHAIRVAISICSWYLSSIILTLFNKEIWSEMPAARTNTATLIAIQSVTMSALIALGMSCGKVDLSFCTLKNVVLAFFPMAALSSMDIAFTNSAYSYVSVSVVVVVKSTLPCLTYCCGHIAGLNNFCIKKILILVWIAVTVSFTVNEMELGNDGMYGIALSMFAVMTSAVRWTIVQLFVKPRDDNRRFKLVEKQVEPMELVCIQQPLILLALIPVVLGHDQAWHSLFGSTNEEIIKPTSMSGSTMAGPPAISASIATPPAPLLSGAIVNESRPNLRRLSETLVQEVAPVKPAAPFLGGVRNIMYYATFSSVMAFAVVTSEIYIIKYTDSTTLTVAGIGKEVLTLIFSCIVFGDELNFRTQISILATLVGIFLYTRCDHDTKILPIEEDSPVSPFRVDLDSPEYINHEGVRQSLIKTESNENFHPSLA